MCSCGCVDRVLESPGLLRILVSLDALELLAELGHVDLVRQIKEAELRDRGTPGHRWSQQRRGQLLNVRPSDHHRRAIH